jgi:hypothetical protein
MTGVRPSFGMPGGSEGALPLLLLQSTNTACLMGRTGGAEGSSSPPQEWGMADHWYHSSVVRIQTSIRPGVRWSQA